MEQTSIDIREVELRGTLPESDFMLLSEELKKYPNENDDKETYFYVTTGFILKIEIKESSKEATLVVKNGDETKNALEEIRVRLDPSDVPQMLKILEILGFSQVNIVKQKRINYFLEDDMVLSLKYTDDWGYHFEIEKMSEQGKVENVKEILAQKCKQLKVKFMNTDEIAEKIREINKKHGFI